MRAILRVTGRQVCESDFYADVADRSRAAESLDS
jgi:hypothetical protein